MSMKKIFGVLFAIVMLIVFSLCVSASSTPTLSFNLSCDGENEVSKNTGDIITVTFTVNNSTDTAAGYDISSITNEIYYDHTFFELVEDSAKIETGLNLTTKLAVYSWGEHRMYFSGFELPKKEYAANQVIGTFQLKIIATEGSSNIYSVGMVAGGNDHYNITWNDLAVKIGDAPVKPVYTVSFETNGGSEVLLAKGEAGTEINLSRYNSAKSGFYFGGWYSDKELTSSIQTIELNENTTVYAKWIEKEASEPDTDNPPDTEPDTDEDTPPATKPGTNVPPPQYEQEEDWSWLWWLIIILLILIIVIII